MESLSVDGIAEKIASYVKSNYVADPNMVVPMDRSLLQTGVIDSFAFVSLVVFLENEFQVTIPDQDLTPEIMGSINKMAHYVATKGR